MSHLQEDLLKRFQHLHSTPPEWAWPYSPACPLVGSRYRQDDGLLVYASAENFTWHSRADVPTRFTDDRAWNRYRACLDENEGHRPFPNVGIQPFTDGGLFAAALFISTRLGMPTGKNPRQFLEALAISNWAKFTIKKLVRNEDYAANQDKLAESLALVVTELAVLQPKVALVPRAIWSQRLLRAAMRGASPFTRYLAVPQFNATVVNCQLGRYSERGLQLRNKFAREPLGEWMRNLHGFREENAWRYIGLLDELLDRPSEAAECTP